MLDPSRLGTYPSLVDRVVVISGGASGIGAAMTETFAHQGARVIVLDVLADEATRLFKRMQKSGGARYPISIYTCDLTDVEGALRPAAGAILREHPAIHVLINNHVGNSITSSSSAPPSRAPSSSSSRSRRGGGGGGEEAGDGKGKDERASRATPAMMDVTPETWDRGVDGNLRDQFFLTQALMPGLLAAGSASVINMGSGTWSHVLGGGGPAGNGGVAPQAAADAGLAGLTRSMARELGPRGVRVNSIIVGAVAPERRGRDALGPDGAARLLDGQALKVVLQPDDVARTALWLAADDSRGVTDQSIAVDGGRLG